MTGWNIINIGRGLLRYRAQDFYSLLEISSKPDEFLLSIELIVHIVSVSVIGKFNIPGEL